MAKLLVLAKSGFGKTTSICGRAKLNIKGLNPKETFIIQCINRGVPSKDYILTEPKVSELLNGNRCQVASIDGMDRYDRVAKLITALSNPKSPYKNIVVDDFNMLSQNYYMANALKGGWDTSKQIGYGMSVIFKAIGLVPEDKNIFCMAHYEEYKDKNGDSVSYKFKTVGNMVDNYITPEANFDIILYGVQSFNEETKQPIKQYVKTFDGIYPAKDSLGLLDELPDKFPDDLGLVADTITNYYKN